MKTVFEKCKEFLEHIGITVKVVPGVNGFLDHIRISEGGILIDPISDQVSAHMLHEAGHIAVVPSRFRQGMNDNLYKSFKEMWAYSAALDPSDDGIGRHILQSGESEAIAWSYAAAKHIGIDTMLPFEIGFNGPADGAEVHYCLSMNSHFGINGLYHAGMTKMRGEDRYPKMIRWMQL